MSTKIDSGGERTNPREETDRPGSKAGPETAFRPPREMSGPEGAAIDPKRKVGAGAEPEPREKTAAPEGGTIDLRGKNEPPASAGPTTGNLNLDTKPGPQTKATPGDHGTPIKDRRIEKWPLDRLQAFEHQARLFRDLSDPELDQLAQSMRPPSPPSPSWRTSTTPPRRTSSMLGTRGTSRSDTPPGWPS